MPDNRKLSTGDLLMCCSAKLLSGFGEDDRNGGENPMDEDYLTSELLRELKEKKAYGYAFVQVILTEQQVIARRVLYKLGFNFSKWMLETKHSDNNKNLRLYWIALNTWEEGKGGRS